MSYICVICTLNRPPLLPLAIEHRRLLEAIVSPINMSDLKACHLLLCMDCQVKMLSIHQFQKTAVQGIRNLKYLLSKVDNALPIRPFLTTEPIDVSLKSGMITIKIEPGTTVPAADEDKKSAPIEGEPNLKTEPQHPPEKVPVAQHEYDSGAAVSSESAKREPSTQPSSNLNTTGTQTIVRKRTIRRKPSNTAKVNAARYCARVLRSGVRKRYKIKIKPKPVPCPHCDQKLSHAASLRAHISRKHTEADPSKCDDCGAVCRNAESLRYHKYNHNKKEQTIDNLNLELFCAECAMHFSSRSAYETHRLALKHTPREQYSFECQVCQKKFPRDRTLRQHIDIQHLNLKKHKCAVCGKMYARGASLRQHMKVVHEKRGKRATFICDLCGKAFKIKKGLTEHMLMHQGLRPYQCKLCPATFSYNAALYNHNNSKHLKKKRKKKKAEETIEK